VARKVGRRKTRVLKALKRLVGRGQVVRDGRTRWSLNPTRGESSAPGHRGTRGADPGAGRAS
jgi:DNA-binding IclR family transcriptional regulator